MVTEQKPVESFKLIFSQCVVVLVDQTFFYALPLLHAWSAFALYIFNIIQLLTQPILTTPVLPTACTFKPALTADFTNNTSSSHVNNTV